MMIAAQQVGLDSTYTAREWLLTIAIIAAVALIVVMANKLRDLQADNRRLSYDKELYFADRPETEGVHVIDWEDDPVDEVGMRNDVEKFFADKPGEDPMARRNR